MSDTEDYRSPTAHLREFAPLFGRTAVETVIDVAFGVVMLYSLLHAAGSAAVVRPVGSHHLFAGFVTAGVAGWVLYVSAGRTRTTDRNEPDPFADAESLRDVDYDSVLAAGYSNGMSMIYKAAVVALGATLATSLTATSPVVASAVAVAYPVLDHRVARRRFWLSPGMWVVSAASVVVYVGAHVTAALVMAFAGIAGVAVRVPAEAPSLLELLGVIQPDRGSLVNLVNGLGRRTLPR